MNETETFALAKKLLGSLPQDVAQDVVTSWLRETGVVYKLWQAEDIESVLDDDEATDDTPEERAAIIEAAQESSWWRSLGDCTDSDWSLVAFAIQDARDGR